MRPDGSSALVHNGIYDMASLDAEVSPELEERVRELAAKLDTRETKAQFKLEVFFRGGPRRTQNVKGIVACWTNGGFLNGGGDAAVYLCPQETAGLPCLAPIDMQFATPKQAVCTRCRRVSSTKELVGQIIADIPLQQWARNLVKLFHLLDCNADLRICVERGSMHRAAALELGSRRGGEAYAEVTRQREWITYPLANIIVDTASGAGLETRFRAFLEA